MKEKIDLNDEKIKSRLSLILKNNCKNQEIDSEQLAGEVLKFFREDGILLIKQSFVKKCTDCPPHINTSSSEARKNLFPSATNATEDFLNK